MQLHFSSAGQTGILEKERERENGTLFRNEIFISIHHLVRPNEARQLTDQLTDQRLIRVRSDQNADCSKPALIFAQLFFALSRHQPFQILRFVVCRLS